MFPHVLVQQAGHLSIDLCSRLQISRSLFPEWGERGAGGLPGPGDCLPDHRLQDRRGQGAVDIRVGL